MITTLLEDGITQLKKSGLENPRVEVEALLSSVLRCRPTDLYVNRNKELSLLEQNLFAQGLVRRMKREPVAYIEGRKNFMGLDFSVDPRVLIPRPETEQLVETVLKLIHERHLNHPRILDVGTGSGCIAVTLARFCPSAEIVAVDRSAAALSVAHTNANQLDVAGRIRFYLSDIYRGLEPADKGDFDIIVSNPPYVSESEMAELEPDLAFEPTLALNGGPDGLAVIRPLIAGSRAILNNTGFVALEIGYQQAAAVQALLKEAGCENTPIIKDDGQKDRIALGFYHGSI